MDKPVYVAAVWSIAHGTWAEFAVSRDGAKVRHLCDILAAHTATHVRIVCVERDDWDLIRPALSKLGVPAKGYTPREAAMFFDGWRDFGRELAGIDCEVGRELVGFDCDQLKRVSADLGEAVPFERRRRSA